MTSFRITVNNCEELPIHALKKIYGDQVVETIWSEICIINNEFYQISLIEHDKNLSYYNLDTLEGNNVLVENWFDPNNQSHKDIILANLNKNPYDMDIPDTLFMTKDWKERILHKFLTNE